MDGETPGQVSQSDFLREQRAKHQPVKSHFCRQRPIDAVKPLTFDSLGNEQHCLYVGENEVGCFSTRKEKQNKEGQGGANPDRWIKSECATEKKLLRRRLAGGIRDDETGNNEEYFNAHPAEPRERRSRRELNVGAT
jgi:hypothetical protein